MNFRFILFFLFSTTVLASNLDELNSVKILSLNKNKSYYKFYIPLKDSNSNKQTTCGIRLLSNDQNVHIDDLKILEKHIEVIDGYRHQRIFKLYPDFMKGLSFNLKNIDESSTVITVYTKSGLGIKETIKEVLGNEIDIYITSKLCRH